MTVNETIDKVLQLVEKHTRDNCDDHTPYYGACVSCGQTHNWELITNIDGLLEDIEGLKTKEE